MVTVNITVTDDAVQPEIYLGRQGEKQAREIVFDLSALRELPSLETLHLEHTAVRDLGPLEALPGLKTVTVSRDMLPLKWSPDARFAVILVR